MQIDFSPAGAIAKDMPAGQYLQEHDVAPHEFNATAATMAFVTLSFSELVRAYTARSERFPLLKIGVFSNKNMNWAVLVSLALLLAAVYIPFLNTIFDTVPLTLELFRA